MSFFTGIALRRPTVTILLVILVLAFGISTWSSLPAELFPQVEITTVRVVTFLPGSNPDAMVKDVTEPIEEAITGLKGLEDVESTSFDNRSVIMANFAFGTDMKEAESDVIAAVAGVTLPENAREPIIEKIDPGMAPIVQLSVLSNTGRPIPDLQRIVDDLVIPKVEAVDGAFSVNLIGEVDEEIVVEVDVDALEDLGLTLGQIAAALAENNVNLPAGDINDRGQNFVVRTIHELGSVEDIRKLVVGFESNAIQLKGEKRKIRLEDVAMVRLTTAKAASVSRTNGRPSLAIAVTKEEDANTVAVAEDVLAVIQEVKETLPKDIEFITISNVAPAVVTEIDSVASQGIQGFFLAMIIVFAFLLNTRSGWLSGMFRTLRPTLVIGITIPVSIFAGVVLIGLSGLSLNMMTLAGLAIAIGRVVDDGIVVLENMYRYIQTAENNFHAALQAIREVGGSVVGSTLATIAVFAPLAFIPGLAGEFFFPMAISVSFALVSSTVVALTVVPVLGSLLLRADDPAEVGTAGDDPSENESVLQRFYTPIIRWSLSHKAVTLVVAVLMVAGSVFLLQFVPVTMFPPGPPSFIQIDMELPSGTSISRTFPEVARVEAVLDGFIRQGHVAAHQVTLGSPQTTSGPGVDATGFEFATFTVSLPDEFPKDLADRIRAALPSVEDAVFTVTAVENIPISSDMELVVTGPQFGSVAAVARELERGISRIDGIINLSSNVSAVRPEVIIIPDLEEASELGLTTQEVAQQVNLYIAGRTVTEVNLEGIDMDVVMRARPEDVDQIAKIKALPIEGSGDRTNLGSIATVGVKNGPTTISRLDTDRSATINGLVVDPDTAGVGDKVNAIVAALDLPVGVEIKIGGVFEDISETFAQLTQAMMTGIILIFIILVALQGNLRNPLVILLSMPLALVGGILALLLTGRALGISSMMGFLMLIGVVTTNALILIEFVEELRQRGYGVFDALVESGRTRVRPILMTACTTTIALVPLALGLGGGTGIVGAELATVVIGGLVSSTILTLVVVPVIYTILYGSYRNTGAVTSREA